MSSSWNCSPQHPFVPASEGEKRSPCPALNALANHGYLPRDGKNIGLWQLIQAIRAVYNLSFPLAALLSLAGILVCGHAMRLDLDALAMHNKIEHDASLVHADATAGDAMAPIPVDRDLLRSFLAHADRHNGMSLHCLAQLRVDRETHLNTPLDLIHSEIGTGEVALGWLLLKDNNGQIPLSTLRQWYGEERIPENWSPPQKGVGIFDARQKANEVAQMMETIRGH
ncbi:Chloroperoxidase [Phlebopus sp. FC_14]|nr:Chloroperoxidase [Phlebopus sp. FC_14]